MQIHLSVNPMRYSRLPRLAKFTIFLCFAVALVAPMNFVLIQPAEPVALFPKTIAVKGVESHTVNGQMYLLAVYVTNPETKVLGAEVLGCWVIGRCAVLPRSVIYSRESTDKSERASGSKEMSQSQSAAILAAKGAIVRHFPAVDISKLSDSSLTVNLDNVGGPSAGIIFTLGLVDLLTPEDLLQGRKISGTGTVDRTGRVGAIGGVQEKIMAAKSAKASVIFVPAENCSDLPKHVEGISVVALTTIDQAIGYLQAGAGNGKSGWKILNSAGIHGCANLGA